MVFSKHLKATGSQSSGGEEGKNECPLDSRHQVLSQIGFSFHPLSNTKKRVKLSHFCREEIEAKRSDSPKVTQ